MQINKSTRQLKNEAKAALEENTKNKLLLFVVPVIWNTYSIISSSIEYASLSDFTLNYDYYLSTATTSNTEVFLNLIGSLLISFILAAIIFTYMDIFHHPAKKVHPINDISNKLNFKFLGKVFVINLLIFAFIFLWLLIPTFLFLTFIVIATLSFNPLAILLAVLSFLAMLFISVNRALAYSQTTYLLHDHYQDGDFTIPASHLLAESVALMKGEKMNLLILGLSFILWQLLVLITFGLAAFWVMPYVNMTNIAFHHHIKAKKAQLA